MSLVPIPVPETAMLDWPTAEGERALRQALGYTATAGRRRRSAPGCRHPRCSIKNAESERPNLLNMEMP